MKRLLILLLLFLSSCSIKEEPPQPDPQPQPEEVVQAGEYNDLVILKDKIVFPEYDTIHQDFYSNTLALYKDNKLVGVMDMHGNNLMEGKDICSIMIKNFYLQAIDVKDPAQLVLTCDGQSEGFAYAEGFKSIYSVGETNHLYNVGLYNTLRMLYILEKSTIVKEIDVQSYLNRQPGDPLIIKDFERQDTTGVIPIYELKEHPKLIDDVLSFDLTGKVGYTTSQSFKADYLGTIKFDGVGADTSAFADGLITVIVDGKLGLADKAGNIVVEPIYEPVRQLKNQIFQENFVVTQQGPKVSVLPINNFIFDERTSSHFISDSSHVNGYREVKKEGNVGFLDQAGKELDSFYFDDAYVALTNRVWVRQGKFWAVIELGKEIGYQEKELKAAYESEIKNNQLKSERFLKGEVCDSNQTLYEVTAELGLYVRDGADDNSGTLGVLNYQHQVCGLDKGDWIEFDYLGQPGYLFKEYTKIVK